MYRVLFQHRLRLVLCPHLFTIDIKKCSLPAYRLEQRLMSKCIERMIREYPVRKPLPAEDPTRRDGEESSDPGSVDNTLIGKRLTP